MPIDTLQLLVGVGMLSTSLLVFQFSKPSFGCLDVTNVSAVAFFFLAQLHMLVLVAQLNVLASLQNHLLLVTCSCTRLVVAGYLFDLAGQHNLAYRLCRLFMLSNCAAEIPGPACPLCI